MKTYKIEESKEVYQVISNSDLTEGRGWPVVLFTCELESTAIRLSHKRGVMGSDAYVEKSIAIKLEGMHRWFIQDVLQSPSEEDKKKDSLLKLEKPLRLRRGN